MRRALLIVDDQPTFCEGGGLPVEGGNAVSERIAGFVAARAGDYDELVASQDWHIDPGDHWAPEGTEPDFVTTWTRHGQAGTAEAALHPALRAVLDGDGPAGPPLTALVRKGMYAAAYSAFEGVVVENPDDLEPTGPPLAEWLHSQEVTDVDVLGIATDHCVRASALDAVTAGFNVRLLADLATGVAPDTTAAALDEMAAAGVDVTTSAAVTGTGSG
jgi:nicotinamidase/pyrazinamidase